MSASGALRFGRYAFPPNRLGYCGPEDHAGLFERVVAGQVDRGLVELERRFDGAYPYLVLIAQANAIRDPFDERVVDAYWIGNRLLDRVAPSAFYESLRRRFLSRIGAGDFRWLAAKLELGAMPHHNFHVFDVYVRAGLMNGERAAPVLETMDACRISWGRVVATEGGTLLVRRRPLRLQAGRLGLGEQVVVPVARHLGGRGFVDGAEPGAHVSLHWSWACEVLGTSALARLRAATERCLRLANRAL